MAKYPGQKTDSILRDPDLPERSWEEIREEATKRGLMGQLDDDEPTEEHLAAVRMILGFDPDDLPDDDDSDADDDNQDA